MTEPHTYEPAASLLPAQPRQTPARQVPEPLAPPAGLGGQKMPPLLGAYLPLTPHDNRTITPAEADVTSSTGLPRALLGPSERDELTGLLGRHGLQRRLAEPVPAATTRAVAVLDIDAFSLVNDTYGAATADQVLRALAARLTPLRGRATLGRWHADEFILVLDDPDASRQLEWITSEMREAAGQPLPIGDLVVHLGMSAGLVNSALSPIGDLPDAARQALRAAKQGGRDRLVWFHPKMARAARRGMALANDLRAAFAGQQLRLHYQPIVRLTGHKIIGVEALVRWEHPTEGLLSPKEFINMAERTGLIMPVGSWVLQQACDAAVALTAVGAGLQTVAVNLSAQQLTDPSLVEQVQAVLEQARCPASALILEVTETAVMTDMTTAVGTLQQLKDLGVQLALDDFGTGYCSLLYLKHFPVDTLKIDRSFVAGLGTNPDDSAIVASTISLARTLGIACVAEGVETIDQLKLLASMECEYAQGYLFSRPLPLDALQDWLGEHADRPGRRRPSVPPEAGPDIAQILHMHSDAASLHTIAAALNATGRRTSRGVRWSTQSVAQVIARAQYPTLELPRERPASGAAW